MIWLITLVLLALAAWLLLNALNEKQWVDAHRHDENVAQDDGLFASFTGATKSGAHSDTAANITGNLREKSEAARGKIGEKTELARGKLTEKISEARQSETAGKLIEKTSGLRDRVQAELTEETGMWNKVKTGVSTGVEKAGQRVDDKIVKKVMDKK